MAWRWINYVLPGTNNKESKSKVRWNWYGLTHAIPGV